MQEAKTHENLKLLEKEARDMHTCVSLLPHWPRNGQGKNRTCPVITPIMDNCDGVKTGHIISHEWCIFPQNQFQYLKVECLIVLIIKKKSGNDKSDFK